MENLNVVKEDEKTVKRKERGLFVAIAATLVVVVILAIIGFLTINPKQEIMQGEVDANSVRVSGLMPGRVEKFYVTEGQKVHAGDTLAKIHSATVDAKLAQALAMQDAADAQRQKANAGARSQVLTAAYDLWQQAKASLDIHKKTYERLESLYKQNVVPAQKRDEAKAAYDITLIPKGRSDIRKVEMQVEKLSGVPVAFTITDKNDATFAIYISAWETNINQPDSFFSFDEEAYPEAEIIDLR